MKKIVSALLCLCLVFGMTGMMASASEDTLKIVVANDLHLDLDASALAKKRNSYDVDFAHVASGGQLHNESLAIITSFFEKVAKDESEFVLLPGDLISNNIDEHKYLAEMLSAFETRTGKKVFVAAGNHDLYPATVNEFKEIYAEFGYSEALAVDSASASYTAELSGDYRLISIDSCLEGESEHGMTQARLDWIAAQGEKAKADGKRLIAMMHHNLIEHLPLEGSLREGSVVNKNIAMANVLAKAGVKYIFTAHTHEQDIASYTAEDGTVIYDVVTGSLNVYPCPYRFVTFGNEVKIETKYIDEVDTALLPEGISENALSVAEENFSVYAYTVEYIGIRLFMRSYLRTNGIINLLDVNSAESKAIVDKVGDRLEVVMDMPLYAEDEAVAGESIEAIVKQYETVLPKTGYDDMLDLAVALYIAHVAGDEDYPAYSDEIILFSRGMAAVINYALQELTAEEYAYVLSALSRRAGIEIPVDFLLYAGDGIKRFEGIEILVTTVIIPVAVQYTDDVEPGDNNVTLPGYAELVEQEEEKSFWDKLVDFFKMLFDTARTIFAFLPFFD